MKELSSEIHVLLNSAAQNIVLAADEYIDPDDGLIHCKSCGGQRQAVVPIPGSAECFTPRCLCPCQTLTEQHRRAAEEQRKRIERIRRSRELGLQGRHLCDYTFDNDNGHNPLMEKAHAYVNGWDKAYASNTGLLLFGDVGTGKSFFAGCIANALLDKEISVMMTNFPTILSRLTGMPPEERVGYI